MKVMLAPVVNSTGQRKNKGAVNLVMEPSHDDPKTGGLIPTKRIRVGLDPVDVTGCKDPMLDKCLESGKLVMVSDEALEAAEEAQALEDEGREKSDSNLVEVSDAAKGKGKSKAKGKGFFGGQVEDK